MTREEAILCLKGMKNYARDTFTEQTDWQISLDMAIKALEMIEEFEMAQIITGGRLNGRTYAYKCGLEDGKRKALEQEPCEDAISRQDVFELAKKGVLISNGNFESVCKAINELPPVTPQPKTGHWISHYDEDENVGWYECDRCHTERAFNTKFCPDCGCRMFEP